MKALITGGAGCIGSDLADSPGFRFVEGDLLGSERLEAVNQDQEIVTHLAANPDVKFVPGEATDKDLKQNTLATYSVPEGMRIHGVKKLAFASTSAIYGISDKQPIPEDLFAETDFVIRSH